MKEGENDLQYSNRRKGRDGSRHSRMSEWESRRTEELPPPRLQTALPHALHVVSYFGIVFYTVQPII